MAIEFVMNCDPILDMRLSQADLKVIFERNKDLARVNPVFNATSAVAESKQSFNVIEEKRRNKYNNIKVEHGGLKFDSKKELRCYQELKLREKAGEIENLTRQVPFILCVEGKKIGRFTVDFTWLENGKTVVADTKSPATRKETAYRLRKKIFEAQYAPLTIREL